LEIGFKKRLEVGDQRLVFEKENSGWRLEISFARDNRPLHEP
jgi:hypothetical protein